nr:hypothetical protein BaRGS_008488 [Batillaria attramentaria]
MRSLQNKVSSNQTFHSSRSSIATDYSLPENGEEQGSPGYSFPGDLDAEAALDERMLEDNMDMIIPDDMQRFLMERYNNSGHSQSTPDEMQRFFTERCNSVMSGSENQQQRQQSQMSFGDSTGVDSGCGSQMSQNDSSSVVSNFMQDQQQLSPPMSGHSMQHFQGQGQGQGHFSPNLHVQTGFDSAMSSPMPPAINSPYSNPAMTPSPMSMPPPWPQQGQGHHPQGQGHPQGDFMPQQQQQQMPPTQPRHQHQHQLQHNNQMQNGMPTRSMMVMSQGGHCPNNMMNANNSSMPMMSAQNCVNMGMQAGGGGMHGNDGGMMNNTCGMMSGGGMHGGGSQGNMNMNMPMGGMNNCGTAGPWQGPMPNPNPNHNHHHHHQNTYHHHQQQQQAMMQGGELPGSVYSPMPMVKGGMMGGGDGMGGGMGMVKPNRSSPQVQVPHISQSQIPPNAKAASRGMMMRQQMMNQQMQQQQQMPMTPVHHPMPPPQPPSHPQHQLQQQQRQQNMYVNNGYQTQYNNNNYPQMYPNSGSQTPNMMDNAVNGMNHSQDLRQSQSHHRGMLVPPGGASTPTGMFRHPHPPSSQHPSCQVPHRSPHSQQPYPYPMEMSPGCNQVTSSTDRKETTAPPIEDFMENITSLSTENLIENISTDNVFGSTSALSNRSASQNSSRFNPVLNTSNMVVNDMSSMLTQLAEENKYLSMRP